MNIKKSIIVVFSCIALFLFALQYLHNKYAATEKEEYVGRDEQNSLSLDVLDYHFLATNFAFTNQFPVSGYLKDTAFYRIKPTREVSRVYLDMFIKNGPVTCFMRPPLIPLVVGCIYKIFGFKYYYNLRLNILLLSIIVFLMPLVGFANWGWKGHISGIIGALIFLKSVHDHWFINTMGLEVFSTFLFFLTFSFGLWAERRGKPIYYFFWGCILGLDLLAKPMLASLPVIYFIFMLIKYRRHPGFSVMRRLAAFFVGFILIVSPWTVYINHEKSITIQQRELWCQKTLADTPMPELNGEADFKRCLSDTVACESCDDKEDDICFRSYKGIVRYLWTYHARTKGFVFITNALGDAVLLWNNEYCVDGDMHSEYLFIKSSFYRSYCDSSQSTTKKLSLFYSRYPQFILKIPISRLINSFSVDYARYFWLAAALWSICIIQLRLFEIRKKKIRFVLTLLLFFAAVLVYRFSVYSSDYTAILLFIPLVCLGSILFTERDRYKLPLSYMMIWISLFIGMFFLGPYSRYMMVTLPVSCLCMVYFSLVLAKKFKELVIGKEEVIISSKQ